MVREQLWIANSALVGLFFLLCGIHSLTQQEIPVFRARKRRAINTEEQMPALVAVNVEKIYQNDLFGTYNAPAEEGPTQKNLVTPIPEFSVKASSKPPKPKPAEFLSPLKITIKGIILSDEPSKSIAMVADQTNKEQVYHVGDKIQDAQIIKLTKNMMVALRDNGQQETFYLRKPIKMTPGLSSWEYAIKKIDDNLFHIDPIELTKELTSVGEVIEALDLSGVYKNNQSQGVRVGSVDHHPLGEKLGLQHGDLVTKVNNIPALSTKDRIKIYDAIAALPMGERIHVSLTRDGSEQTISYLLARLERPSPFSNPVTTDAPEGAAEDDELFKLSKNAQRQQKRRRFEHVHRTHQQHDDAVSDMRKRLLGDMRDRSHHRRVWS